VVPIDTVVEDAGNMGLRIFVEDAGAIQAVADVLAGARSSARSAGKGPVQLCLMDPTLPGEVAVDLCAEYPVTPKIKGAIRSLTGVMEVEEI
jgi:DNA polymerase-3 subunit alpha